MRERERQRRKIDSVRGIVFSDSQIWRPRVDATPAKRRKEHRSEAKRLVGQLTPAVIANPDFYGELNADEHARILKMLAALVPNDEAAIADFRRTDLHGLIVSYVREIVERRTIYPFAYREGDYGPKIKRVLRLRTDFPLKYLEAIAPDVGLPREAPITALPGATEGFPTATTHP